MKYTPELIDRITKEYQEGKTPKEIASGIRYEKEGILIPVPERSVIAKLSSLGVYQRKSYLNKRGDPPIKKEEYIERIANLLDINVDLLESLEKVTKSALVLIDKKIQELK